MKMLATKRWLVLMMALPLALALLTSDALIRGADTANEAPAAARQRAKARGRLPAYYRQVVSPDQRDKIYAVQAKWASQIEDLEKQLADLKAQRDAEVEAVLTPDQQVRVAKLAAEAKAKRQQAAQNRNRKKNTTDSDDTSGN